MNVVIKNDLPRDLFDDRKKLAGTTQQVTHVVINGQSWPVELVEVKK